jgi:hypothetical protein
MENKMLAGTYAPAPSEVSCARAAGNVKSDMLISTAQQVVIISFFIIESPSWLVLLMWDDTIVFGNAE